MTACQNDSVHFWLHLEDQAQIRDFQPIFIITGFSSSGFSSGIFFFGIFFWDFLTRKDLDPQQYKKNKRPEGRPPFI